MKLFSLSHVMELAQELPDPAKAQRPVLRLPIRRWDAVRDAKHPDREFEVHENPYVEFEIVDWKDKNGAINRRWVLRGLVAM